MPKSPLSVIIITKNEERDIAACLESVQGIASEIIVVDSGSTDHTLDICRRYTNLVYQNEWTGFGPQKQFALDRATQDWVLNLDADERLSPESADEIAALLGSQPTDNGFYLPFHHFFAGKRLRYGGAAGEKHLRLFRRTAGEYPQRTIHEGIAVKPPHGRLKHPVRHFSYWDTSDYLSKCNFYTTLMSKRKFDAGARLAPWHHLRLPFEFVMRYVVKLGFLDGQPGFVYAALSSFYVWLKYVKLKDWEAQGS